MSTIIQSLGMVAFNFQEIFLKYFLEGKEVELRGIIGKLGKIISSNVNEKYSEENNEA